MSHSPADPTPPADPPRLRRGLLTALRRDRLAILAAFCLVASTIFLAAPFLKRTYAMGGALHVTVRPFDPLPELGRVVNASVQELQPVAREQHISMEAGPPAGDVHPVHFSTGEGSHDAAFVRIHSLADRFTEIIRHRADEILAAYASSLTKQSLRLDDDEAAANRDLDGFRRNHRGALPDDPDSILKQYDKLSTQLDEKESRLRLLTEQITRLEEYKKGKAPLGPAAGANTPSPSVTVPAPAPAADREVASLTAQLQLMADQIDEQLNKLGRTEQHPYVVDLKRKQADLQKQLDTAKARVANGQPPPADLRLPPPPAGTTANEPSLVAAQALEVQLSSLHAEKDLVDADMRALAAQRAAMQKEVDSLASVRREYETFSEKLADFKKARQSLAAQKDAYNRQFGGGEVAAPATIDVSTLALDQNSTEPTWPRLPAVYGAGLGAGVIAALLLAALAAMADRALHSVHEAQDILAAPVLGVVSEIRSPLSRRSHQLWRGIIRPLLMMTCILLVAASAYLCHRHLSNPGFRQEGQRDPARMLLSAGNAKMAGRPA